MEETSPYTTEDEVTPSDSTPTAYDEVTNFDVDNDVVFLPENADVVTDAADVAGGDGVTVTFADGIATVTGATEIDNQIVALLTAMDTANNYAILVNDTDSYVVWSDGDGAATDADIVVKLAGVDLSADGLTLGDIVKAEQ